MSNRLQVLVYENRQLKESAEFDGPVELGRQRDREEAVFSRKKEPTCWRWVIARRDEVNVGRNQLRIEPRGKGTALIRNGSDKQPIRFTDRADLEPGGYCEAQLPVLIILGPTKSVRVLESDNVVHTLGATAPPRLGVGPSRLPSLVAAGDRVDVQRMLDWLSSAMEVLQAAAGAPDFFDRAARAVVETASLDSARVILRENERWVTKTAQFNRDNDSTALRPASTSVLARLLQDRCPCWELPSGQATESLQGLEAVVAAPILGSDGEVKGALYGERRRPIRGPGGAGGPITELEARLVELLARGVAAGLARLEEEKKAIKARADFEHFFSADLVDELANNPSMLEGQERMVTVMFCDIREFSTFSNKLGPARTIEWCREVLDMLSECVLNEGGAIIDYVGDGLMAIWGAPKEQTDQADRALRAALDVLARLPSLSSRWESILGKPMSVGIGINTGKVMVGNVGSKHKFKYGAMGNAVNVASRVQNVTKIFRCKVLLTGETFAAIQGRFTTRKLCDGLVRGIKEVVALHELLPPEWQYAEKACQAYQLALNHFMKDEFAETAKALGNWRTECRGDDAVLVLMLRAVEAMVHGKTELHPVFNFRDE